ncbi:UDP-N-acetylmuramate dehydrogenase [Cardiobacteriaceae bacterium TAE3-ERU3]|nr:UDP-N-acetylmuramate dehydrogenase [Cardiobacteriaceae bacterium TAE3-ERU3]
MQILNNVDLAAWHTLRAQAQAKQLTIIETPDELADTAPESFVLGGGSNVIFVGEVARPIVHLRLFGREVIAEDAQHVYFYAAGGETWHDVVRECAVSGWYGLENLALIPGTVGAAPVQNIGAYGVEVAQVIERVHVYDRKQHEERTFTADDCAFAYRQSHFKGAWRDRYIITGVTFRLAKKSKAILGYPDLAAVLNDDADPEAVYKAVCGIRRRKLPDPAQLPNAGSFFHNPIVSSAQAEELKARYPVLPVYAHGSDAAKISAGWCIEQCGFKGLYHGAVGMYEGHALVLVNKGGTGKEILTYAAEVQAAVKAKFGVALHIEPIIIGENHD